MARLSLCQTPSSLGASSDEPRRIQQPDLGSLVALVKDGAKQRDASVRDELERALRVAYLGDKAPVPAAAPTASGPLASINVAVGQRVTILADGAGTYVIGTVVGPAPAPGQPFIAPPPTAEPSREPRTPCFEPDSQENWAG